MATGGFTTCLWFDGRAEEAANHYVSIFKDSRLGGVMRTTGAHDGPAGEVLTVEFELNGQKFLGLNGGPVFTFNESVSFMIHCADQDEVDHYWYRLTEGGGEESQCGWLKDKFGVSWQVIPAGLYELVGDPDPVKAERATRAMFTMRKLDIAELRRAHAGA
ncbi:VOC family protein [Actinomadura sp. KC345]|uniref:VOC family protein n=1 Tax=Actinomadura sp. KC345 TaxID=2530371 RepID=UPI001045C258|nr:VOC family protein [Actinomadura sp. KC345]TDC51328.1 VOC family protein [Actinomadura sp. KC345]